VRAGDPLRVSPARTSVVARGGKVSSGLAAISAERALGRPSAPIAITASE